MIQSSYTIINVCMRAYNISPNVHSFIHVSLLSYILLSTEPLDTIQTVYSLTSTDPIDPREPIWANFCRSFCVSSKSEFPRADLRRDICLWTLLLDTNELYISRKSDSSWRELTPGVDAFSSATRSWCFWFNSNRVGGLAVFDATNDSIRCRYSSLAFSIRRVALDAGSIIGSIFVFWIKTVSRWRSEVD